MNTYNNSNSESLLTNISNMISEGMFIYDLTKQCFTFISSNIENYYHITKETLYSQGANFYQEHLTDEGLEIWKEMKHSLASFFSKKENIETFESYTLHINLPFKWKEVTYNIAHHLKASKSNGAIGENLKIIGLLSFPSKRNKGNIYLQSDASIFLYNNNSKKWNQNKCVIFTPLEKKTLFFSMQGYTTDDIATLLYKSKETIKTYKKNILTKTETKSITEAINHIFTYNLL